MIRGYHKPIMIAGGLGNVRTPATWRRKTSWSARPLVVLGGPSMLIGLGGGAASSVGSGQSSSDLDFASVQRGNAEIQRRAQEVIDRCWALGEANPILLDSRRRRRRVVERAARGHCPQPARRPHRPAQHPERRVGTVADGDLVQRSAGALRAGARSGQRAAVRGRVRTRALSLRRGRRDHRRMVDCSSPTHCSRRRRSTCRSRCCSARRRA